MPCLDSVVYLVYSSSFIFCHQCSTLYIVSVLAAQLAVNVLAFSPKVVGILLSQFSNEYPTLLGDSGVIIVDPYLPLTILLVKLSLNVPPAVLNV